MHLAVVLTGMDRKYDTGSTSIVPVSVIEFDGTAYIGLEAMSSIDTSIDIDDAQNWLTDIVDLRKRGRVGELVVSDDGSYDYVEGGR